MPKRKTLTQRVADLEERLANAEARAVRAESRLAMLEMERAESVRLVPYLQPLWPYTAPSYPNPWIVTCTSSTSVSIDPEVTVTTAPQLDLSAYGPSGAHATVGLNHPCNWSLTAS